MAVQTIVVGDEAALLAAMRAATGETIIKLKAGTYDTVSISGVNPAAKITVTSQDFAHKAVFDILTVTDSSNLTFQDVAFRHLEAGVLQVRVNRSHDIAFVHDEFMGVVDSSNLNDASGLSIGGSSRISVLDSRFHDLRVSIYATQSDHLMIAGNDVRKVREGFDFTAVDQVTIDRNLFTLFNPLLTGTRPDHPDGIQFWTTGSTGSNDVEITNNAFLFGNKIPIQGILIGNELGDAARHSDFVIANNVYQGQSRHGISVYFADDVRITGNTVVSAPKSGTAYYLDPAINTTSTTGAEVDHNIASMMFSASDTGRVAHDNIDAWDTKTGVGVAFADLFAKVPTGTPTPDAFLAKAGSAADLIDAGYTHVDRTGNWASVTTAAVARYHDLLDTAGSTYHVA